MKRSLTNFVLLACLALPSSLSAASRQPPVRPPLSPAEPQQIVLRHALSGPAVDALATLVLRFNDEEATLKGLKNEADRARIVLEDVQGVADKARLPHLALLDLDDAMEMFDTRPRFRPLHQVMATGKQRLDPKFFYPQMFYAVDDIAGKMQALPLALSLPVLFYNKAAFVKAGINPDVAPQTWWELQAFAGKLRDADSKCPLTSSRFAWVHVENVAAQHAESPATKSGKQNPLALNNLVNVKHLALLTSWHKSLYFIYSGRGREGEDRFLSGECAMLTAGSALYARLVGQHPDLPFGVAVLPHYDDVHGARPGHVLPDGAALWVLAIDKDSKPRQQAIARFIAFLMRAEVQRDWVRATGFLPMSPVAAQALRELGGDPGVLAQVKARLAMPKRDAVRIKRDNFDRSRIRNILSEEIELVWGEQKPPKAALDTAVARAASVLAPAFATRK